MDGWEAAAAAAGYGLPVETGCGQSSLFNRQPLYLYGRQASLQLEQFHIENERGVWRDDPRVACRSVCHVWCAGDFSPLTQAHLKNKGKPNIADDDSPPLCRFNSFFSDQVRLKRVNVCNISSTVYNSTGFLGTITASLQH